MKVTLIIGLALALGVCEAVVPKMLSDSFIAEINSKQSTWTAGRNFPEDTPVEYLHQLASGVLGLHPDPNYKPVYIQHNKTVPLDENFDSRNTWPQCESLKQIRNQGACGSCWAFSATESMTDRTCIHSNGKIKHQFSPEDLLTCCSECTPNENNGCKGGYVLTAFEYWDKTGIVTGGDAGTGQGCRPYSDSCFKNGVPDGCNRGCSNGADYNSDKRFGKAAYMIGQGDIEYEISVNGPVAFTYKVYEDFYNYKSGVYSHTSGNEVGYHAVKAIGFGVQDGTPYWLIANSWGTGFGNDGGFFKIRRGNNECEIESWPTSGIPIV